MNSTSVCYKSTQEKQSWPCNHYERRCMVKFDCCDKYWPCSRCHNEASTCKQKPKTRDTTMIKCMKCEKEQQFGENGQFCISCNTRFADFYCGICKHLTGKGNHPYHCEKCGICRNHGDRSFHCDICGVCLDVQLKENHKCRPDSGHEHCGICLEDTFKGSQILPCFHKVHKECLISMMIQSGITRCSICRESFDYKSPKAGKKPSKRR
ncbi:RING finger and CHY zinc finger domain-containing protein 1-like isoform X1 [Dendronephthya gigantea]|uniref:RING finger and CHY zinc finger domain-containing protein 1-like isoform X1 n=1 Tax=Dendronephthya gigantea TaxID=151771 RepID=UPI001069D35E|nr:RING finger and CHY zinc finger domain-containing protein 1-like isoform X1 [Dendronephthya gigantea]XP_028406507.1 RING finger and CHY zinc finger domain-containing protein 1-like isoform X1 [Dendronephthya gigantea]XP_028406508.1 RING finger and CHY zinc finger domain-containing protein 1-like isoform X1 [Dendronephthya gigantea]XP_028406509.1 RING finger and CHY zinc finger domain-containing protein 1-like isoform X1 [Dendronephthya gigantea]